MLWGVFYRETRFFALAGLALLFFHWAPRFIMMKIKCDLFVVLPGAMISPYMSGLDEPEHSLPQRLFMILLQRVL